jgi:hypothetical protein
MKVLKCRRTVVALFAITCLTVLGYFKAMEVAASIATIAMGVAAANAFQGKKEAPH